MKPPGDTGAIHRHALIAVPAAAGGILLAANVMIQRTPAAGILLCLSGSLCYFVFIRLKHADHSRSADYLQTGEAAFGSIALLLGRNFTGAHPCIAAAAMAVLFFLFEMYLHHFLKLRERELAYNGILLTALLALFIVFFFFFDSSFTVDALLPVFLPYRSLYPAPALIATMPSLAAVALFAVLRLLAPELALLSHGGGYFRTTGLDYPRARTIQLAAKSVAACASFYLLGWLGGAAFHLASRHPSPSGRDDAALALLCIGYTQALLLVSGIGSPWIAVIISICFGWGMYFMQNRTGMKYNDRVA